MQLKVLEVQDKDYSLAFDTAPSIEEPLIQVTVIPNLGTYIQANDPLFTIETCSRLFTMKSPLAGIFSKVNYDLLDMIDKFDFSNWVTSFHCISKEEFDKQKAEKASKKKTPNTWAELDPRFVPPAREEDRFANLGAAQIVEDDAITRLRQQIGDAQVHRNPVWELPVAPAPRPVLRPAAPRPRPVLNELAPRRNPVRGLI